MYESERHRIILSAVQDRPIVSVMDLCQLTGASEATIRRDIAALHVQKKLRRVRGGAEALSPPPFSGLSGRPFSYNKTINAKQKQRIARAAVELCEDGDSIIINGGTTTFEMVHPLATRRLQVFTNSFAIAEHLLKHSKNSIMLSGGIIYREQNIILSPFENDASQNFYAQKMFMGAKGIGPMGLMESDPLVIRAEQRFIGQAQELIVLVDSSKFDERSSLVLCPLQTIDTVITDEGITDKAAAMLEAAEVNLIVAPQASSMAQEAAS